MDGVSVERLVGGDWNHGILYNFMTFHLVGNFITPTDELIFQRGDELIFQRGRYTTNQKGY